VAGPRPTEPSVSGVIGLLGRRVLAVSMALGLLGGLAGCAAPAATDHSSLDATPSLEASPSPVPAATPTCAERYPDPGPAGIDLRLGCIVNLLVATATGGQATGPPRISEWLATIGAAVLAFALLVLGARRISRSAGRRLASVEPEAWWSCPSCRSLNASGSMACYRCGRPWDATIPLLEPDPDSLGRQATGRRLDR
jgi:hypothetical protein